MRNKPLTLRTLSYSMKCLGLLLTLFSISPAQESGQCKDREIIFEKGQSATVLRGQLEPCERRVYKFRAREGQRMSLSLFPAENDVVFWLQSTQYIAELHSHVLDGIHKNGVVSWEGELPRSGVYEIVIARPSVSNSPQQRTLPYRLKMRIE